MDRGEARAVESMRRLLPEDLWQIIHDPDVTEWYINPGEEVVRVASRTRGRIETDVRLGGEEVGRFLMALASWGDKLITAKEPRLETELPKEAFGRSRLAAAVPPIVSTPSFMVRKLPTQTYTLDQWTEQGALSEGRRKALREAVRREFNILVVGSTDSGKTTLASSVLREIAEVRPGTRVGVLEDLPELVCLSPDHFSFRTDAQAGLGFQDLLYLALRYSPRAIVVGEVRDAAAHILMKAWCTGHVAGVATVHASSAAGGLERIDQLCQEGGVPSQAALIAEAVQLVVFLEAVLQEREGVRRVVREMVQVCGVSRGGEYELRVVEGPESFTKRR